MISTQLWGRHPHPETHQIVGVESLLWNGLICRVGISIPVSRESDVIVAYAYADSQEGSENFDVPTAIAKIPLSDPQKRLIEIWLAEFRAMHRPTKNSRGSPYVCIPHQIWIVNRCNGRKMSRLISHAGFVFEAFRAAGISLVCIKSLPPIAFAKLRKWFRELEDHGSAKSFGFTSETADYEVLLPGYLLNCHESTDFPKVARPGDAFCESRA